MPLLVFSCTTIMQMIYSGKGPDDLNYTVYYILWSFKIHIPHLNPYLGISLDCTIEIPDEPDTVWEVEVKANDPMVHNLLNPLCRSPMIGSIPLLQDESLLSDAVPSRFWYPPFPLFLIELSGCTHSTLFAISHKLL